MRQFKTVFKFEYTNYVKSKSFIVMTAFLLITVLIGGSFPALKDVYESITNSSSSEEHSAEVGSSSQSSDGDIGKAAILASQEIYTQEVLQAYFGEYEWVHVGSFSDIEERILNEEYVIAIKIDGINYTLYLRGADAMSSSIYRVFGEMVRSVYQQSALSSAGLSDEEINQILYLFPQGEYITVGKDISQSFWLAYVMLFMLYFAILMYGQFVSTSVITEKTSKAMELLITSAKPICLIFGKVVGTGFAGLTQFGIFSISAFVIFKINAERWQDISPMIGAIMDMSLSSGMFIYAIVFFILGFLMFAFVYAGTASTVSRMEDASSVVAIPMMLFIASFMVAMVGMASPEASYIKICSYVPFLSPLVMFMRICVTDIAVYEIILGIILNILYVIGAGYISTKIYRVGVMLYGTTPKPKDLIRYIRQS